MSSESPPHRKLGEVLERIASVTDTALSHLDGDNLLNELLDRVCDLLSADTAAVLSLDLSGRHLIVTAGKGIEEEVHRGTRIPVGQNFAGRIVGNREPVIIEHADQEPVLSPILRRRGIRSFLGVPLLVSGTVTGVLHVGTLEARRFTDDDAALLELAADRVAMATEAQRSRADRAAAMALQRSLVPAILPEIAGYELAARYLPGTGTVGGDWYDVFTLPSGEVGIALGDVAGAGLPAAVVMGRLRSALRAYALDTLDPSEVLTKLDRKMRHFEPTAMATVLYAVAEPAAREIRLSVAGHPLPVLAQSDQETTVVDTPIDPPVGVQAWRKRHAATVEFPERSLLCFYTDGLIERRDSNLDVGLERLRGCVTCEHPDLVCATVMDTLIGDNAPQDDTAVLAVRATD